MTDEERLYAINGLRAASGKLDIASLRFLNPEGNFIGERTAFETNDEETKARILREQGENHKAVKAIRTEREEQEKVEDTFRRLQEQRRDGAARSTIFGHRKG